MKSRIDTLFVTLPTQKLKLQDFMGFILTIVFIGSISVISFLALYILLIFIVNFIQKKKERNKYFIDSRKKGIIFSDTANETVN